MNIVTMGRKDERIGWHIALEWSFRGGIGIRGICWGIYRFGSRIGLDTPQAKMYFFLGLCVITLLFRYGGRVVQLLFGHRHGIHEKSAPSANGGF